MWEFYVELNRPICHSSLYYLFEQFKFEHTIICTGSIQFLTLTILMSQYSIAFTVYTDFLQGINLHWGTWLEGKVYHIVIILIVAIYCSFVSPIIRSLKLIWSGSEIIIIIIIKLNSIHCGDVNLNTSTSLILKQEFPFFFLPCSTKTFQVNSFLQN